MIKICTIEHELNQAVCWA